MFDAKWSPSEKRLARELFEHALHAELNETVAESKARAAAVTSPEQMWSIRAFLAQRQREIDEKYDYRYSQLLLVFSRLVREGRLREEQLAGLSEDKLSIVKRFLSL
jgi:steroid 5-alpha reductase family enzyme